MIKFLAIVKREYLQRVRAKMFIVTTSLLPLVMLLFGLVPILIVNIDAGSAMRVAVIDETGRMYEELNEAITGDGPRQEGNSGNQRRRPFGNFILEPVDPNQSAEQIKIELERRLQSKELDGYLLLPKDFLERGQAEYFNRNPGDAFSQRTLESALNRAVREQRLINARVDTKTREELFKPVNLQARSGGTGEERDLSSTFGLVFGIGFVMYLSILMYGQVVLGAVIEEKETRIAEILFSSVKPFTLMMGKLVGVSIVALTQLTIWGIAFSAFAWFGVNLLASRGVKASIPSIPFSHFIFFGLFFLLGYFIYATIYALVGSMVTTAQEGGQLAMPIILILVVSFYLFFPVSRSPDSTFSFWVSMIPFTAPVAMLVRIVTQTPPLWQIALSLLIGFAWVVVVMWIASRIYRVGMLMYGKRASLPEAWRWARQA